MDRPSLLATRSEFEESRVLGAIRQQPYFQDLAKSAT